MLKRIVILVFILSTFAVLALAPMNVTSAAGDTQKLQTTIEPTSMIGITVEVGLTSAPEGTPSQNGLPMSTLIIFGLIAVLAIAVVSGGMALMSRRR